MGTEADDSGACSDGETGQAHQQISDGCGAFSDTLDIPDLAYTFPTCGEEKRKTCTLTCALNDSQVLSVLQDLIVPMLRPRQNCPRAAILITSACAVRNAVVRAVIRRRVRSGVGTSTSVSAKERVQHNRFVAAAEGDRPSLPPLPDAEEKRGADLPGGPESAAVRFFPPLLDLFYHSRRCGRR